MTKKRKRTKPIITRKQKRLRLKPSSHRAAKPEIKISEAILQLCEPLRKKYREPHRTRAIISIAIIYWNFSLFPEEERSGLRDMLLHALPDQFGEEKAAVLLEQTDHLIAQKEKKFGHIREYIVSYQLDLPEGVATLTVVTVPVPEKIQRK